MPIISVRVTDAEHAALVQRAGRGRGALSRYLRQRITQPSTTVTVSVVAPTTTTSPSFIEWMTGHVGPNLNLRTL